MTCPGVKYGKGYCGGPSALTLYKFTGSGAPTVGPVAGKKVITPPNVTGPAAIPANQADVQYVPPSPHLTTAPQSCPPAPRKLDSRALPRRHSHSALWASTTTTSSMVLGTCTGTPRVRARLRRQRRRLPLPPLLSPPRPRSPRHLPVPRLSLSLLPRLQSPSRPAPSVVVTTLVTSGIEMALSYNGVLLAVLHDSVTRGVWHGRA